MYSQEIVELVRLMLSYDYKARPDVRELFSIDIVLRGV